jgi:hypothetical protein
MPKLDYDRYQILRNNDGSTDMPPFVEIPVSPGDKYEEWREGFSRMDVISQKYYSNPFYDFFILYANPQYISEFDIPDGTVIRIPFPLDRVKLIYENSLTANKEM